MAAFSDKRRGNLTDIPSNFSIMFHPDKDISLKSKQQGFKLYSEGYVHDIDIYVREDFVNVSGKCFRSQRKSEKPHSLLFDVKESEIVYAYCSCQAWLSGSCSHVIGMVQAIHQWQLMGFTEVPSELSCTSMPQAWNVPRGLKIDPQPVTRLHFVNAKMDRKRKPIQNLVTECRKIRVQPSDLEYLQSLENCPMSYIVSKPKMHVRTQFGNVPVGSGLATQARFHVNDEDLIPVNANCGDTKFPKALGLIHNSDVARLSWEESWRIEEQTRDQASSPTWFSEREGRLTASQFGLIIKRRKITPKFISHLMDPKAFTSSATSYGTANEKTALSQYIKKTGNHTHKCGLLVNPDYPYLGASPDSKVCVDGECGFIEVKCPFSARDKSINEA